MELNNNKKQKTNIQYNLDFIIYLNKGCIQISFQIPQMPI